MAGEGQVVVAAPAELGTGGLGAAAAQFAEGFEAAGREVEFVGTQPRGPLARAARSRPFRRAFGMGPSRRAVAAAVRRAVPGSGWDLAVAPSGVLPLERGTGVRVLHQATRHPLVHREAMRRGERETGGRGEMSTAELRRRLHEIDRADLIHVSSLAVRAEMLDAGVPAERLVHAYLGVDLDRYRPGLKREVPTVAFVGPLSMGKGVDVVAELAARLRGAAVVETVGGPTCPWSRRVVAGAAFARRDSVAEMLAGAHFFVLPSRADGFSYAVLEALASGAVPIVTPQVGAAEIVRRLDPRLVIERQGFAAAAADLMPRLDLAELAPRARELAEEFEWGESSRALAAVVLERAGCGS